MPGKVLAGVTNVLLGRLALGVGAAFLAVFSVGMLVGGKSLLSAVGLSPKLAGGIAALSVTVLSVAGLAAFAKYGIDWD